MKMQKTRWRPDTCGCVLEYTWDSDLPQESRTHTVHSVAKCPAHSTLTIEEAWGQVKDENETKNQAIGLLVKEHPELEPHEIAWNIKEDRNVEIILPDNKKAEKTAMDGLALGKFKKQVEYV
jgi:hypothetical protein